jgi:hypothetical protein
LVGGVQKVIDKLQDLHWQVRLTALYCIKAFCDEGIMFYHFTTLDIYYFPDEIQKEFISINGMQKVVEKLQDSDWNLRLAAIDCIQSLCVRGKTFLPFIAAGFYYPLDNIRTLFISNNGVQKLIEKLNDFDKDVRQRALDCLKMMCVQGIIFCNLTVLHFHDLLDDIRTIFISMDGVQKLSKILQDMDKYVRKTTLDCIKALCVQGIIFLVNL